MPHCFWCHILFWFTPSNSACSAWQLLHSRRRTGTTSIWAVYACFEKTVAEKSSLISSKLWLFHYIEFEGPGQQGNQNSKRKYCYQNRNIWEVKAMSPFQLLKVNSMHSIKPCLHQITVSTYHWPVLVESISYRLYCPLQNNVLFYPAGSLHPEIFGPVMQVLSSEIDHQWYCR